MGIGLALVKGLVEMHGGSVTAESGGPGLGSTFTVRLPVLEDRSALPDPTTTPPTAARGNLSRRVLVVDDNRDGAKSMAEMLTLLGHEVLIAHDGREAVAMAEQHQPDLILMDIGMPNLNGLEATRQIREQTWGRGITILALTGWGQEVDRKRSRESGCDGHLVKPVSLADLKKVLARLQSV